jgi:hypothetical protein
MSKIVAKLVKKLRSSSCCDAPMCNCDEAADGIERLEAEVTELTDENALIRKLANKYLAEVERLRAALEGVLKAGVYNDACECMSCEMARAALTPSQEPRND